MLVACAVTENFFHMTAAMLHSVAASTAEPIEFLLLHPDELTSEGRRKLDSVVAGSSVELRYTPIPASILRDLPELSFPRLVWSRPLLTEMLPDRDRVLCVDGDMIVMDDLGPLWRTDLEGALFGAVTNPLYPFMLDWRDRVGVTDPRHYVNGGLLLLDLARMRAEGTADELREYAKAHPTNPGQEQDALNALYHGRHLLLHPRWNVQTTFFELHERDLPFSRAELAEARTNPGIVHFLGPYKPWHYLCRHRYKHVYFEHAAKTPWPPPPFEGRTMYNRAVRWLSPRDVHRGRRWRERVRRVLRRR